MIRLAILLIEHLFSALDQLFDRRPVPAGPEIGCDDDGAWCDGTDSGETCFTYISPPLNHVRVIAELDYASLENAASGGLGPVDFPVLGRRADGSAVLERR